MAARMRCGSLSPVRMTLVDGRTERTRRNRARTSKPLFPCPASTRSMGPVRSRSRASLLPGTWRISRSSRFRRPDKYPCATGSASMSNRLRGLKTSPLFNLDEVQHTMGVHLPPPASRSGRKVGDMPRVTERTQVRNPGRNPGLPTRILPSSVRTAILLFAVSVAAQAQVYPGGGYPGGGYPGQYPGGGSGIPVPGRSGRNSKSAPPNQNGPLPNFRGVLKVFDEKAVSVELGDKRIMDFRRTDKTKFYKSGDEVKTPKFNLGDQVSVEAQMDPGGQTMTAINVYWEKSAAGGAGTSSKSDDGVVDTWKDDTKTGSEHASVKPTPSAAEAPAPATPTTRDPDDPGPPKLKRGGVADQSRERAPDVPEQTAANRPPAAPVGERVTDGSRPSVIRGDGDEDTVRTVQRKDEPLIRRAADAAMEFTETLPN